MSDFLSFITHAVKYWFIPLIIGILLVVFGIYILSVPVETYVSLAVLFSISFIITGVLDIVFSLQNRKSLKGWGWYFVGGLLSFILGIYLSINPVISMGILPFYIGFTLMFRSFTLLGFALDLKDMHVLSWGNVAVLSVLSIILSFLLLSSPFFTGISIVILTSLSFVFIGISSIALAFDLKKLKHMPEKMNDELKNKITHLRSEIEDFYKGIKK